MHFSSEKFKEYLYLFLSAQMILKSSELFLSGIFILFAIIYLINHCELGGGGQMIEILSHLLSSSPNVSKLFNLSLPGQCPHFDTKYSLPDFCRMGILYLQIPN